jgi:hypothetical protein
MSLMSERYAVGCCMRQSTRKGTVSKGYKVAITPIEIPVPYR